MTGATPSFDAMVAAPFTRSSAPPTRHTKPMISEMMVSAFAAAFSVTASLLSSRVQRIGSATLKHVTPDPELQERLVGSVAELDSRRLQRRFLGVEMSHIGEVAERQPARFGGEIRSQQRSAPGSRPSLRVTIHDGTGSAVAVFTGRSRIFGIEAGRAILFEGVARRERGQLVVFNPAYTLLP